MASPRSQYPDHLNPFGVDDDDADEEPITTANGHDDYPEYLSPFGADENEQTLENVHPEEYDDSLNPFGDDTEETSEVELKTAKISNEIDDKNQDPANPFANPVDQHDDEKKSSDLKLNGVPEVSNKTQQDQVRIDSPQPDSLEPPKPLPRTKSLLKKEQAQKRRQQEIVQHQQLSPSANQVTTLQSKTSATTIPNNTTPPVGSFQRKKNKRNAPPLPINFKRQVCGSLDAIETELEDIGDKLETLEKESVLCQEMLKSGNQLEESEFGTTRNKFAELIRRKNSILRRQKELMYKKRELKLDQIHSDIEYELRMIGNKQLSNRTSEDEVKEKELLKKLVEIVEEKNDIVENLNKEPPCDNDEIEEALKRLNIFEEPGKNNSSTVKDSDANLTVKTNARKDCDKTSRLAKLGKIATLIPKSGTIKGTVKIQKRRLFKKKCDSQTIEG